MDWHELQKHKVDQLRQMAKSSGIKGTSGMSKEHLVGLVAKERGIAKPHMVIDESLKSGFKSQIRHLKIQKQAAMIAGDSLNLKKSRREIHRLKRKIRKAGHLTR
ncbi:MAG: hypothetical protein GY835_27900 [bacterium]|nr:hypothetical protein [bacterium]